jgi:lipopolysaccharide transport protein LptA
MLTSAFLWAWLAVSSGDKPSEGSRPAPLDFRCDAMQVHSDPNKTVCTGHVVIRRGDVWVCCNRFIGTADKNWEWEHLLCEGDVRAMRNGEWAWSEHAEFFYRENDVVLWGNPVLQRGDNVLFGEKIRIDTAVRKAHVIKPRGWMVSKEKPVNAGSWSLKGKLPVVCPLKSYQGDVLR